MNVVIGDGWAALGAVGFLAHAGKPVCWITGTGSRLIAPLPFLDSGVAVAAWQDLASRYEISAGEPRSGSFLREFRNKAFREPAWTKAGDTEKRFQIRDADLWAPECRFIGSDEVRFEMSLGELEEKLRGKLMSLLAEKQIRRLEGVPVTAIEAGTGDKPCRVVLGSGEEIFCDRVIYADRWAALPGISGIPKMLPFAKNREPVGALQAMFLHQTPVGSDVLEGFFGVLHKEAGEEFQRNTWGYFLEEGRESLWTVYLGTNEVEDNHEITKKLRKMKQALDRIFTGTDWVPAGKESFMTNVASEQVRFEEAAVFSAGEAPTAPITLPKSSLEKIAFLTDGYGPSSAMHQVSLLLGEELGIRTEVVTVQAGANPEAEDVSPADSESSEGMSGGDEGSPAGQEVVDQ